MNIWILTSQFPPTVLGGIARYVANAADMFACAGHQVTVIVSTKRAIRKPDLWYHESNHAVLMGSNLSCRNVSVDSIRRSMRPI